MHTVDSVVRMRVSFSPIDSFCHIQLFCSCVLGKCFSGINKQSAPKFPVILVPHVIDSSREIEFLLAISRCHGTSIPKYKRRN